VQDGRNYLNEENWNVVSNNIPVALLGVKLASETPDITNGVCRATTTKDGRESQEDGRLTRCVGEYAGRCDVSSRLEKSEFSKGAGAAGMDDTLGDTFVVEAMDLPLSALCSRFSRSGINIPSRVQTCPPEA
jgi:hypothetical protein